MKKYIPLLVFTISSTFYTSLSAKEWTWLFVSSDSGDWLAASIWWYVPQPVGSPLFVLFGHLLNILPGDLVLKMTLVLSCLASAITVTFVYLILRKFTSELISVSCSVLLLSSAVFLTQSTVLEEYALTTMFMTLALWCYVNDRRKLVGLLLGLAIAVHVFALVFALLWIAVLWKEWKKWLKPAVITTTLVVASYSLILILMCLDTPRLLAGDFSPMSINTYLFDISGGILGTMSVFEAPKRFLDIGMILLVCFSVGLIPVVKAVRPLTPLKLLLVSNITFVVWYVLTTVDPITWTFIALISPAVVVLCGVGLMKYGKKALYTTLVTALILTTANSYYLNASRLSQTQHLARDYYEELVNVPNGAIVVTTPGSYSLGLFYLMSKGKDLTPLVYPYMDEWLFWDYYKWLVRKYPNITIKPNTLETIKANMGTTPIYFVQTPWVVKVLNKQFMLGDGELVRAVEGIK